MFDHIWIITLSLSILGILLGRQKKPIIAKLGKSLLAIAFIYFNAGIFIGSFTLPSPYLVQQVIFTILALAAMLLRIWQPFNRKTLSQITKAIIVLMIADCFWGYIVSSLFLSDLWYLLTGLFLPISGLFFSATFLCCSQDSKVRLFGFSILLAFVLFYLWAMWAIQSYSSQADSWYYHYAHFIFIAIYLAVLVLLWKPRKDQ